MDEKTRPPYRAAAQKYTQNHTQKRAFVIDPPPEAIKVSMAASQRCFV